MSKYCKHPFHTIQIQNTGEVYCCCCYWTNFYSFGNIFEKSFDEIWNGDKAKEFIDKRIKKVKDENEVYNPKYKEIRDYIIDTIGCFFKNQSDINHQKKSFIGYAPVLLAISDYIKGVNFKEPARGSFN